MFQSILLHYHLGLQHNKPVSLVHQSGHSAQLLYEKEQFAQLFYQTGETGFSEQNSVKTGIKENPFHFKLPADQTFTVLRFDPINDFTIAKLNGIRLFDGDSELFVNPKITSNAADSENATYYFLNSDPQIIIEFDEPLNLTEVMIDVDFIKIGTEVIEEFDTRDKLKSEKIINLTEINQDFENQLSQKVAELEQISDDLNQKNRCCQSEINSLQSQDAALRSELITVKSSFDYKLAKHLSSVPPVRFIRRIKEKKRLTKNIRLICESSFFDVEYYLHNNPDVKDSGTDAVEHFLIYGGVEGRNPSEKFDSSQYLETYPDVKISGINPLLHYLTYGKNEGRLPKNTSSAPTLKNVVTEKAIPEMTLNCPAKLIVEFPEKLKSLILENKGNTEFINKYFDRIYVINLRRRQNKLAEITQKLNCLNISAEIIEAIDGYEAPHINEYEVYKNIPLGLENASPEKIKLNRKLIYSPGVWGHLKSNRLILQDALSKSYQKILILEDDVLFMKNFHQEFENFTRIISGKNWKFLYLGATQASWDIPGSIIYPDKSIKTYQPGQPFYHPVSTFGSFALAIHYSQFKSIISKIDEMNCPFDWIYKLSFNHFSEQSFVAQPNLIIADNAESDNRPENITSEQKLLAITRRKWDLTKYV